MLSRFFAIGMFCLIMVPVNAALIALPEEDRWQVVAPELVFPLSTEIQGAQLKKVVSLLETGRKTEARRRLAVVLDADPEDSEALLVAGTILMSDGKLKEAQIALEASLKFGAGPVALSRLGVVRLLMGDMSRGGEILNEALRYNRDDELALRYMAWLAERQGNIGTQQVFLERLVSLQPATAVTEAVSALASVYDQQGAYGWLYELVDPRRSAILKGEGSQNDALAYLLGLSEVMTGQTGSLPATRARVEKSYIDEFDPLLTAAIFYRSGKQSDARNLIEKTVSKEGARKGVLWYNAARLAASAGDFATATEWLESALKDVMSSSEERGGRQIIRELAGLYLSSDRSIDALAVYQKYDNEFGDMPGFVFEHAEVLVATGQTQQAKAKLDKLESLTSDFRAPYLRGLLARREQNYDQARNMLRKAAEINPGMMEVWVQLAGVSVDEGDLSNALSAIAEGLSKNPQNHELAFEYATLLEMSGKTKQATRAYQLVLEMAPDHLGALDNLAQLLLDSGEETQKALELSRRALALAPEDAVLKFGLARAYHAAGQPASARGLLEEVLDSGQLPDSMADKARGLLKNI
jgi:FimV-like protein